MKRRSHQATCNPIKQLSRIGPNEEPRENVNLSNETNKIDFSFYNMSSSILAHRTTRTQNYYLVLL